MQMPQVQFSLWLIRYISTGLLFILGLRAPGLPRKPYMLLINEDERDVENSGQVMTSVPHYSNSVATFHDILLGFVLVW